MRVKRFPSCASLASLTLLVFSHAASAAGGAHVIDDSEVETAGSCHLETWVSYRTPMTGVAVVNPACTPRSFANLELGASLSYAWEPGANVAAFGPTVKWTLRPSSSGLGIAAEANAVWSNASRKVESASFIVPFTMPIGATLTANVNAGAVWARTNAKVAAFVGAQLLWQERESLGFMAEAFERTDGEPGAQAGLRWNPNAKIDIDFLVSRTLEKAAHENTTIGVTKRF